MGLVRRRPEGQSEGRLVRGARRLTWPGRGGGGRREAPPLPVKPALQLGVKAGSAGGGPWDNLRWLVGAGSPLSLCLPRAPSIYVVFLCSLSQQVPSFALICFAPASGRDPRLARGPPRPVGTCTRASLSWRPSQATWGFQAASQGRHLPLEIRGTCILGSHGTVTVGETVPGGLSLQSAAETTDQSKPWLSEQKAYVLSKELWP